MQELTLITPSVLFSAVSLILLAYTNRFLSYAQVIRSLQKQHLDHPSSITAAQIKNLRTRIYLTKSMQILGIGSLLLCVVTMLFIYVGFQTLAVILFGVALFLLILSLAITIREIQISTKALEIYLDNMDDKT